MLYFRRDRWFSKAVSAFDTHGSCVGAFLWAPFQGLVVVFLLVSTILSLSLYQLESRRFRVSCFMQFHVSQMREMLNTLLSSYWLLVHLLLWGSNIFPLFFNGSFVFLFLIYKPSWYLLDTSPLLDSYMYCIFFNPSVVRIFSLFFLMASFDEKKLYNFDSVESNPFMVCDFCVFSRKSLPALRFLKRLPYTFF